MRYIDSNNKTISNPDLTLGYLVPDKILVAHHDAVEATAGTFHYDVVMVYPNGGKDMKQVWDTEPVEAADAWDEYEDVQRYILYTEEELAEIEAAKDAPTLENLQAENKALAAKLQAAIESNQMLEDCLAEMAEIVYA